jgi:catechol 2,3-dioxygenase-like lactoylglutathione lyase family enzyme
MRPGKSAWEAGMGIGVELIHHVQIFVPKELEESAKRFYGELLGLREVTKPAAFKDLGGAWYQCGANQLHLSIMRRAKEAEDNHGSPRHVCYMVGDLGRAESVLRQAGVEIIPDDRPHDQWTRFFVRDPGGNYIEIAQRP